MQTTTVHLLSDPSFLLSPNRIVTSTVPSSRRARLPVLCAANNGRRRNRYGTRRKSGNSLITLKSACILASNLGFLPEPFGSILGEFGSGNGGGSGTRDWFGWGGFDGWRRRRRGKLGMAVGILVICGALGAWLVVGGKELGDDALLGGLGLVLFGVSVEGWSRGAAKDWVLGFCCCAFLVGLVLMKDDLRTRIGCFGTMKKNTRRKGRAF